MSLRHMTRPNDRDRIHEPVHNMISHPSHPPHINGVSSIVTNPAAIANGATHVNPIVSPAVATAVPNTVAPSASSIIHKLNVANEQTWLLVGRVAEQMGDLDHALAAYENALRHNPMSLPGLTQVASIARIKENYPKAVEFFQRALSLQEDNGEVWSALGHCYLMQDDLQKAYSAYQQALYLLPNPKEDPKLWYGIGILYDRYGSLDHAEEAFSSVLRMDKDLDFDKANEILFRLGIIYKQQGKYEESLGCFDRILRNPPSPLAHADIWFQIGHVYEQQKDYVRAKDAYERVVQDNPKHAKVLQQLGWLYHQDGSSFQNQDLAIQYLTKSLELDSADAQSWYLLGRAYMAGQKYNKAYEAYQQAVYRDGRNPTFWCSIGVLYFQINQYRDALDAYSRAIRINPYISEVWFDLGSLYESCNNQISDAIDAYARAAELDPNNSAITQRLQLLRNAQTNGGQIPAAPGPQDVHPTAYANTTVHAPGLTGPPLLLQPANHRPLFRADSRGPPGEISLPPPSQVGNGHNSPGPFRGGPPPVLIDETRHVSSHTTLAPMDVDRPTHHSRDYPTSRDASRGPIGPQGLLLQHPLPQSQADDIRNGSRHGHHESSFFTRPRGHSRSTSPPHVRTRSPQFQSYPSSARQPIPPTQAAPMQSQRSPRTSYPPHDGNRAMEQDMGWERRIPQADHREWEQDRRRSDYPSQHFYPPRSPQHVHRAHSPREMSPRPRYWESKPLSGPPHSYPPSTRPSPPPVDPPVRRYDPRYDGRDARDIRDYDAEQRGDNRSYAASPESHRLALRNTQSYLPSGTTSRGSESPLTTPAEVKGRRRNVRDKEPEPTVQALPPPPIMPPSSNPSEPAKASRKRKPRKAKDEAIGSETPKLYSADRSMAPKLTPVYKQGYQKVSSPEPMSSNGSSRSMQPSPTSATPRVPPRVLDEEYDEADAAMSLVSMAGPQEQIHSPTASSGSRHSDPSPRSMLSHRNSVSSTRSHTSPPVQPVNLKRPLSPGPDDASETKRTRMDMMKQRRGSPPTGRRTPIPSTRPSPPVPLRTQPMSHSPEARQGHEPYPPSPKLSVVLPPHPRPIGTGLSSHGTSSATMLPPITTLSPTSTSSPNGTSDRDRDDRMQVDGSRPSSPPSKSKLSEVVHPSSRSPVSKSSPSSDKKD
ncbi:hypothetical protein M378DRAFT_156044 [Amanita muscaria Koide BX008]|uniref:Cytochrome c-type biogenesis protein H TPR domain-containing protein n=1 Tax=Amanita muscaria (strain Koide BX008) TaxID=946122 RepID=A0A0C2X9P2_AMAMK|nr:hypothetical protein M378DRAFT_156044 [Amanita muscaria Koide BX008]